MVEWTRISLSLPVQDEHLLTPLFSKVLVSALLVCHFLVFSAETLKQTDSRRDSACVCFLCCLLFLMFLPETRKSSLFYLALLSNTCSWSWWCIFSKYIGAQLGTRTNKKDGTFIEAQSRDVCPTYKLCRMTVGFHKLPLFNIVVRKVLWVLLFIAVPFTDRCMPRDLGSREYLVYPYLLATFFRLPEGLCTYGITSGLESFLPSCCL